MRPERREAARRLETWVEKRDSAHVPTGSEMSAVRLAGFIISRYELRNRRVRFLRVDAEMAVDRGEEIDEPFELWS